MEEITALSVQDQGTAALSAFGFSEGEPLKPSKLELIQPIQSADEPGLVAGRFRDTQSNLQYDSLNIVPIFMKPGRVLFPPGGELGAKPVCRSSDGKFPVVGDDLVCQDGGLGCGKCQHSQWKSINGKRIRPACNETMDFLVAEMETEFVFRIKGKGVALAPLRDLRDTIRKIVLLAKSKKQFAPPYGMVFTMSSVKIKGAKGTYYIPKFTPAGQVESSRLAQFKMIYDHFSSPRGAAVVDSDPVDTALEGEYIPDSGQYESA